MHDLATSYGMNKRIVSVPLVAIVFLAFMGLAGFAKGEDMSKADEHRSEVSRFVQDLTKLAGRDRRIGTEIKEVAKLESEKASKSADAMESIENRNPLVTFLFGTDYKNIGTLRSQLVTSQNNITRLIRAATKTTSDSVKADLQKQIDAAKEINSKIEQFIKDNESKFSILGWAVKLFSGESTE